MRQLTKAFKLMALLLFAFLVSNSTAQADSRVNELQYIKTYDTEVDGKSILRIEIGLKRDNLKDYSVKIPATVSSTLLIDLNDTLPGKLSRRNSAAIQLSGSETVSVKEVKINYTRLQFRLPLVIGDESYKVYTELPDKRSDKPYRLIVDIDKSISYDDDDDDYGIGDGKGSIVIDAGHGGSDSGAVGPNGVMEKTVTLDVALKVQNLLQKDGLPVVMTRTTDRDVSWSGASNGQELQARVDKSPAEAAVFVSIHCNAFSNPATNGMETFYYWGSEEGRRLADILNKELANYGGRANRGVKGANFYVLKHSAMPASLVELAFITNPEEEYLLADNDYQEQLALAIARGIKRYLALRSHNY